MHKVRTPVIIAAHAAAPQIHLVILRYGPVRAGVPFGCWPMLAATKKPPLCPVNLNTATAGAAASSWNRPFDRGQNSEDAANRWRLQGRFACDQRHRAETHVKNAQVHHHRQERCAEEAGGQRGDVIHVADNLQIAATRGVEKLESKSSYVELKPDKFKKRTDLKTGRYKTETTRQGIGSIKFLLEKLVRFAWLIDAERDLIGDSDAVTFQSYYLLRVIR